MIKVQKHSKFEVSNLLEVKFIPQQVMYFNGFAWTNGSKPLLVNVI